MSGLFRGILTALAIRFTPTGNIAATNVQGALEELDNETVKTTGNQDIGGVKTFTSTLNFGAGATKATLASNYSGSTNTISFGSTTPGANIFEFPAIGSITGANDNEIRLYRNGGEYLQIIAGRGGVTGINNSYAIDLRGIAHRAIRFRSLNTTTSETIEPLTIQAGGNIGVNTPTDNGVDKLQVTGSGIFTGQLKVNSTEVATNDTTGCARFAGGIGVIGNTYFGGEVVITNGTPTTNNLDGALRVTGGISTRSNVGCSNLFTAGITFQSSGTRLIHSAVSGSSIGFTVRNTANTATDRAITIYEDGAAYIGKTPLNPGTNNLRVENDVIAARYKLSSLNTAPSSATDTGTVGEIRVTSTHIFACIATNTWVRAALSTW
jgi:hypothetical protein